MYTVYSMFSTELISYNNYWCRKCTQIKGWYIQIYHTDHTVAVSIQFVPCIRRHHWLNFKFKKTPKMYFRTSALFWTYSFFYHRISSGLQLQQQQEKPCQWKLIWVKNQEVASIPSTTHHPDNFALDWLRNFWNCLPPVGAGTRITWLRLTIFRSKKSSVTANKLKYIPIKTL